MAAFIFFVPGLLMVASIFVAFLAFDGLLRLEYHHHREDWQRQGKPIGFFWMPPAVRFFQGANARNSLLFAWLSDAPCWAENDTRAKALIYRMRVAFGVSLVSWLLSLVGFGCAVALSC